MKICIDGDIIDTEHIYMIEKIVQNGDVINDQVTISSLFYFSFKIKFFKNISKDDLVFDISTFKNQNAYNFKKKDWAKLQNEAFDKINNFRNSLIEIWNNNKSKIKEYNFEKGY